MTCNTPYLFKVLFVFSVALFLGCSSDDDDNNDEDLGGTSGEYLVMLIEAESYEADDHPMAVDADFHDNETSDRLNIQGFRGNDIMDINIAGFTGVGTYQTSVEGSLSSLIFQRTTPSEFWVSGVTTTNDGIQPGTINITFYDGQIVEGTFSFEGIDALVPAFLDPVISQFTQGQFRAIVD